MTIQNEETLVTELTAKQLQKVIKEGVFTGVAQALLMLSLLGGLIAILLAFIAHSLIHA